MAKEKTSRFGVSIPSKLLKSFDHSIKDKGYNNRSEALRDLIRKNLVEKEWAEGEEVVGSLTIVYDHDVRGVSDKLTEMQHKHHAKIVSSMHVHLDEHNCMEVLVIKGRGKDIKVISDILLASRGVKHGRLVMTTKGAALD